jgi:hypothetical protein
MSVTTASERLQGTVDVLTLKKLAWKAKHGYAIVLRRYAATDVNFVRVVDSHNGLRRAARAKPTRTNEALPQTVEHVGIYADLSVGLRLGLVSLYVVLPRLRRGVALMEKS